MPSSWTWKLTIELFPYLDSVIGSISGKSEKFTMMILHWRVFTIVLLFKAFMDQKYVNIFLPVQRNGFRASFQKWAFEWKCKQEFTTIEIMVCNFQMCQTLNLQVPWAKPFHLFWQQRRVQILFCYCQNRREGLAQGSLRLAAL